MTQKRRDELRQAWLSETLDDWRKALDEESRAYLEELDLWEHERAFLCSCWEFDGAYDEILSCIDYKRFNNAWAEFALAMAVRELRFALLLDREDLASMTGLSVADITAIECCTGNPTIDALNLIAKATGLPFRMSFAPATNRHEEGGERK